MDIDHDYFMGLALKEALQGMERGEFPVGCVITDGKTVIATGARVGTGGVSKDETSHAEMIALKNLYQVPFRDKWPPLFLYSTLEPCLMCLGAILLSPVETIVYAYEDVMGGGTPCDRTVLTPLYRDKDLTIINGVLREQSLYLFKSYFNNPINDYWKGSLLSTYTLDQ